MDPVESLHLIVEASLALAGFAGVVTVLERRRERSLSVLHRLNLVNLLATALGSLFLSLFALLLIAADMSRPSVWRVISAVGLAVTLYFGVRSARTVLSNRDEVQRRRSMATLLAINGPLGVVCIIQAWNLVSLAAFWPVLLLLAALFGVGCYSFVRLIAAAA